jgi:hypothetical protein
MAGLKRGRTDLFKEIISSLLKMRFFRPFNRARKSWPVMGNVRLPIWISRP